MRIIPCLSCALVLAAASFAGAASADPRPGELSEKDAEAVVAKARPLDADTKFVHYYWREGAGPGYYVADWYRFDTKKKREFWLERKFFEAVSGRATDNPFGAEGAMPSSVDPKTKESGYPFTPASAAEAAARELMLPSDASVRRAELWYDRYRYPYFLVEFVRHDSFTSKTYFLRRALVDAHTGKLASDGATLEEAGVSLIAPPPEYDAVSRELKASPADAARRVAWPLALAAALVAAPALWLRRKRRRASWLDLAFIGMMALQAAFALYFLQQGEVQTAIYLLVGALGTLPTWMWSKSTLGGRPGAELDVVPAKALPTFKSVGGMDAVKRELDATIGRVLRARSAARALEVKRNGVLLYGPPGAGKSLFARAIAGEYGYNLLTIKSSDLGGLYGDGSELERIIDTARSNAPCAIFFDEFDAVAGRRDAGDTQERRVVNQLLQALEGVRSDHGELLVLAATNFKDSLDEAVIRAGRFDHHVSIPLPDQAARRAILATLLERKPCEPDVDLDALAARSERLSAADLVQVVDAAVLGDLGGADGAGPSLSQADLLAALENRRSPEKAIAGELGWDDIILQGPVKEELQRLVRMIERPEELRAMGVKPPKGVLLYGPPGTGKTTIARVLAKEAKTAFLTLNASDLYSKWLGETEQRIKRFFADARQHRSAIVFIDEIDALFGKRGGGPEGSLRDDFVSLMLTEIDGLQDSSGLFIVGATNRFEAIDPALLRGGRLSTHIEIPAPGEAERLALLKLFLRKAALAPGVDLAALARRTAGRNGADLREVCDQAVIGAFERRTREVSGADLENALARLERHRVKEESAARRIVGLAPPPKTGPS